MTRERLRADRVLVERGYFESRSRAQEAIRAGLVKADGRPVAQPSDKIASDAALEARPAHPFVSRGALKLAAALDSFALDPIGMVCLDVGSSTGGFTELLLRRGARHVVAVDVGREQLHRILRTDPRITLLEGTDIRNLDPAALPELPEFASIDVSFISLKLVLPAATALLAPGGIVVALVKPQFEAGRDRIGGGGVVRDASIHDMVCNEIGAFAENLRLTALGLIPSPITGGDGNREFLIGLRKSGAAVYAA